ncbi:hypothetical protein MNEG_13774 [Monoraphidium neglectum]|uniref:LicD/FKTN/FKRP nucleotidyltransferase domain-containing protein n=1 Tax=Monoraphidium neglectum TaxID=145388 RepID=A0A0D2LXI7_9CHLO|nr:hypothetical protein MNEG_13774 [Monoraphidium neglectum]KIY94186.1 hypothetical protein MNEG_13774 [Monoraphidium neglectum]|eukprot:XP_013893206.1 hypothetical protein MNEG_13774 [Monoraphidium neglectum]
MFSSSHQRTATGEAQVAEQRRRRRKHRSTAPQRQQQQHEEEQQQKQHEQLDDPLGFLTRITVRAAPPADGKRCASLDGPPTDESSGDEAGAAGPRSPKAVQPLAYAAVGALTAYYGIKGILGGYQQLRRRNLRALIRTVSPVLGSLGATYWLDFGSLLGAHREGDVIAHDNDADVVVLNPDWDELLVALRAALPQYRVFFVVPSEDRSIRWIRLLNGVGVMDVYGAFDGGAAAPGMVGGPS